MNKKSNNKTKVENRFKIVFFRVFIGFVFMLIFATLGTIFGAYIGIIENAPTLSTFDVQPNIYSTILYFDGTEKEYDRFTGEENREYAIYSKIPEHLKNAFIAVEDERFRQHNGIDVKGILRAIYVTLTTDSTEGASTITQQLIKNTVMNINRNVIETKLQEQYLAIKFENALTEELGSKEAAKNHILEVYLNTVALHYNLNGVQTAANFYFGKEVSELSISESAVIAAITQNPSKWDPIRNPENNKIRKNNILLKMYEQQYITQEEYERELKDDVYSRIVGRRGDTESNLDIHSFYSDAVFDQVSKDLQEKYSMTNQQASYMIYNSGLKINVPIDTQIQSTVDEIISDESYYTKADFKIEVTYRLSLRNTLLEKDEHFERKKIVKNEQEINSFIENIKNEFMGPNHKFISDKILKIPQPQVAFIITDPKTGYVKAISGGRGEKTSNRTFNRATHAERQPGSVFKILAAFAPALDSGTITAGSAIEDSPITYKEYGNWTPSNHWGKTYRGMMTVREAISTSANVVTSKVMHKTGVDRAFNYLKNFGFTTLIENTDSNGKTDKGLATSLGGITKGVLQTEVVAAFSTISNNGYYNRSKFYTVVYDRDGKILLDNREVNSKQVLKEGNAYILTDLMKTSITSGTGVRAGLKNTKIPVAGKTGTTSDTMDLTFVGYTPYYAASIWYGHDKPTPLAQGSPHLNIWRTIMEKVHQNLEFKNFEKPENLIYATVCKDSGKKPILGLCDNDHRGNRIISEIFISGTQPTEYCDFHGRGSQGNNSNNNENIQGQNDDVNVTNATQVTQTPSISENTSEIAIDGGIDVVHIQEEEDLEDTSDDEVDKVDQSNVPSPKPSATPTQPVIEIAPTEPIIIEEEIIEQIDNFDISQ